MSTCVYCGGTVLEPHPVMFGPEQAVACSEECAEKTTAFMDFFNRKKVLFFLGIGICLVLTVAGAVTLTMHLELIGGILIGAGLALLGLTVFLMPFSTPQTVSLMGIRGAVRIVKIIGLGIIVLGALLAVLLIYSA